MSMLGQWETDLNSKNIAAIACTYCPTKVDKQLGGPFLDFWPIRPIKKINGASPQPPNTHWKPFNLIWAFFEWLEDEILEISDFWKMSGSHFSKTRKKWVFENAPHLSGSIFSKTRKKMVFEKIQIFDQLPGSKIPLLAIHKIISHIWEDAPRKVNNDEPDLRFFYGNFWPVISRTIRKPCPRGGV